ncbi:MAG: PhoPQ-activated protein PqaA family protein, partial [Candidatus Hydrogenedens sp.]
MIQRILNSKKLLSILLSILLVTSVIGCATKAPISESQKVIASTNARETKNPGPLDTYVYKPDPNYSYKLVKTEQADKFTIYYIHLTSQSWRSPEEVDRPIWTHWLTIVVPKKVKYSSALLIISGGGNSDEPPTSSSPLLRTIAKDVQTVVAEIKQIPNQPLVFANDNDRKRSEDAIIAYNWDKYLKTGEAEWLTRMPMTKAVVRAMDTVQEFCASKEGGKVKVNEFVVAGASKRGW